MPDWEDDSREADRIWIDLMRVADEGAPDDQREAAMLLRLAAADSQGCSIAKIPDHYHARLTLHRRHEQLAKSMPQEVARQVMLDELRLAVRRMWEQWE